VKPLIEIGCYSAQQANQSVHVLLRLTDQGAFRNRSIAALLDVPRSGVAAIMLKRMPPMKHHSQEGLRISVDATQKIEAERLFQSFRLPIEVVKEHFAQPITPGLDHGDTLAKLANEVTAA
jgi:hypothetical protein